MIDYMDIFSSLYSLYAGCDKLPWKIFCHNCNSDKLSKRFTAKHVMGVIKMFTINRVTIQSTRTSKITTVQKLYIPWIIYTIHTLLCFFVVIYWLIILISFRVASLVQEQSYDCLGAVSIRKTVLPGMAIPMLKIRRPNGRLIFNMEIAIRR